MNRIEVKNVKYEIEHVSFQMANRFKILDELIEGGYMEKMKPIHPMLPTLCISIKTKKFNSAPKDLRKQYARMFSWYAFVLGPFAFTQTKLAKDYFIVLGIISIIESFMPTSWRSVEKAMDISFNICMSYIFIFSRYYQYQSFGKNPSRKNVFSTICFGFIWTIIAVIPGLVIESLLYGTSK
jgi:hypothetical protein